MEFQFAGGKSRVRHWGELFGVGSEVSYGETGLGRGVGEWGSLVPGAHVYQKQQRPDSAWDLFEI